MTAYICSSCMWHRMSSHHQTQNNWPCYNHQTRTIYQVFPQHQYCASNQDANLSLSTHVRNPTHLAHQLLPSCVVSLVQRNIHKTSHLTGNNIISLRSRNTRFPEVVHLHNISFTHLPM